MWTFREAYVQGGAGNRSYETYQLWRGNTKVIESFASESPLAFVQRCIQAINSHEEATFSMMKGAVNG